MNKLDKKHKIIILKVASSFIALAIIVILAGYGVWAGFWKKIYDGSSTNNSNATVQITVDD